MADLNLRTLCTALGFTAVVMQSGQFSKKDAALRATGFANLIEAFCLEATPDAPANLDRPEIDVVIQKFKYALNRSGSASLPQDRATLVAMYDRLLQRKARRERSHFYDSAHDDLIANAILAMVDEELSRDGEHNG